jgi:hypothetical protein
MKDQDRAVIIQYLREDPYGPRTILTPLQLALLWMWVG